MKLLLTSDLHYTLPQLDWILDVAGEFDAVVLAGDHLDLASPVDLDAQITVSLEYFARLAPRTNLVVCSGNHDLDSRNDHDEKWASWIHAARDLGVSTDGDFVEVGGWGITVCGWWDGPGSQADVDEQLSRDAARGVRPWAWVYHWPPPNSPVSVTSRGSYGDEELTKWIGRHRPDLVFTGHVHESPFRPEGSFADELDGTIVLNAGRERGPFPAHVEVDTDAGVARWRSLGGADEVSLPSYAG